MIRSTRLALAATAMLLSLPMPAVAQEAVVPVKNAEALFTSKNPTLNRNKQAVYHIMKDLLEAGHWEQADRWLTDRYIQHNPNVASGRDTVVRFFGSIGMKPKPIPARLSTPVVSVTAEGDMVVVATVSTLPHPTQAGKTYTTTWFDMWRMKDGKADEHWDSATIMVMPEK